MLTYYFLKGKLTLEKTHQKKVLRGERGRVQRLQTFLPFLKCETVFLIININILICICRVRGRGGEGEHTKKSGEVFKECETHCETK